MSVEDSYSHEIKYRSTSEGYDLLLRSNEQLETQRKLGLIVLDEKGITELVMDKDEAEEAFDHPSVTPGIKDLASPPDPWDEVLDAYNNLEALAKQKAMKRFERIVESGAVAPIILLTEVQRVSTPDVFKDAA